MYHYGFKDATKMFSLMVSMDIDAVKDAKNFFFHEFKDLLNNIYIDDVSGFRRCNN